MTYTRAELVADAKEEIKRFIDSGQRNAWVSCKVGEFYMRGQGFHNFNDVTHTCFDVANVTILPLFRGVGIMHELLEWINSQHTCEYTYIESIQNDGFYESLVDQGWEPVSPQHGRHVVKARSDFDPTAFTFVVQEQDMTVTGMPPCARWEGRIEEFPQFVIYEKSERHVRRELFRFIEEMHPLEPLV
jgi:hypothetical protein